MTKYLIDSLNAKDRQFVGGKGFGLYQLIELGLLVPQFLVLSTEAFQLCCQNNNVPEKLPKEIEDELDIAWQKLSDGNCPLAARSSAVSEDGTENSFAGQMDTVLNILTREQLSQAVITCWKSLYSERAQHYVSMKSKKQTDLSMAVVIQKMIYPTSSGVLFTVNPMSGNTNETVINSVWGLGEGLVSGLLSADSFLVDVNGKVIFQKIVDKPEQISPNVSGGTEKAAVSDKKRLLPSLETNIIEKLAKDTKRAELIAKTPLDIEFAVVDCVLYYLQARPITALGAVSTSSPSKENEIVWDNSNINESYPGVSTPLTFSFIRNAYHAVYWQFAGILGYGETELRDRNNIFRNMIGLHRGRVYYNLNNWYKLVSFMPGFEFNSQFMEGMMGVKQKSQSTKAVLAKKKNWFEKYFIELPKLIFVFGNLVWSFSTLTSRIKKFHENVRSVYSEYIKYDYDKLPAATIMSRYWELEAKILWQWRAPIINDFAVMIFYGLLKKLSVVWLDDKDLAIPNTLISQQGDIESVEVMNKLIEISSLIQSDNDIKKTFLEADEKSAIDILIKSPKLAESFKEYMEKYGDRCVEELKLESKTMREDPSLMIAMLKSYIRSDVAGRHCQGTSNSNDSKINAAHALKNKLSTLPFVSRTLRYWIYLFVLNLSKKFIKNRENQRLERTRVFGLARTIFNAVGKRFFEKKYISDQRDIYYLEIDEMDRFINGTSTLEDLKALIALRKKEYDRFYSEDSLPDHFVTYNEASVSDRISEKITTSNDENYLTGMSACPGKLTGEAVVLSRPDASIDVRDKILVARQTDPGWGVLFHVIKGLIVERGSMLSHSAIVAREMGIPTIVAVTDATKLIKTGDKLELDADIGVVRIIR